MKRLLLGLLVFCSVASVWAQDAPRDRRLARQSDYNGRYGLDDPKKALTFAWTPPASKSEWDTRREQVRRQLLVANGLWPMPEKTPLKPVIHGKIERDGYTI